MRMVNVHSMMGMDHVNDATTPMPHMNNSVMMGNASMHHMAHNHSIPSNASVDHSMHDHGTSMTGDHGNHMVNNNMDHTGHMGGHQTHFNFNYPIQVLFLEWLITSEKELIGSCIGVCAIAILYESLKVLRQYLLKRARPRCSSYDLKSVDHDTEFRSGKNRCGMFNGWHILQSFLHIIQTTLGMFLMLIYMTFNVWLALSVSVGAGVGYFLFAWNNMGDINFGDHCQ
ncbi:high affinity copper uptake protein 1-like isoform X2 [Clavelina lepadiformis]|uniref:high affinity copper uptake protein 1-like isoform X2 n=1 Tax=Clavelina lepadiformis TaxID=159417 RepID=UPI004041F99F